jgi:hypothetical protein
MTVQLKRESVVAMGTSDSLSSSSSSFRAQEPIPPEQSRAPAAAGGGTWSASSSSRQRLARLLSQLEELRLWSEAELQTLQAGLSARISELEGEIHRLESRAPSEGDHDVPGKIARQLQELAARGDAVYGLLVTTLAESSDRLHPPNVGGGEPDAVQKSRMEQIGGSSPVIRPGQPGNSRGHRVAGTTK